MPGDEKGRAFGQLIRTLRKERRLSQETLALAVGVSRQSIVDWESKAFVSPKRGHVKAAARVLGAPLARLDEALERDERDRDVGVLLPPRTWRVVVDDYLQSDLGKGVEPRLREQLYRAQPRSFARELVHAIRQSFEDRSKARKPNR